MNKNAIKKFAIDARNKLIASVTDKAGMLGITPDNCSEAITKGADFEVYKTAAGTEVTLNKKQCEQRRKLVAKIYEKGFESVVEEVAYTWFNRICAIRFMEVNDYMYPVRVRVLSSEKEGKNEPDVVTMAPEIDWDFTDKEREEIIDAKMNNRLDDLFRMLFIKQCNLLHEVLPGLFEETEDYTEMLLNISFTNEDDVIRMLVDGINEKDFNITTVDENGEAAGQVEIIGWLYQYYISQKHDEVVNMNKGSIKKEDIPAATQLFTTDWVVRYMVDNSLGRYWIERNPQSKLAEKLEFFITSKTEDIQYVNEEIEPTDLTFFDPCMGSGHILIYAFDVLMEIYRECGYSDRDAAISIVENNLFGLDIDKRAYQLAYFAVMMKARSFNRRAMTSGMMNHLSVIEESDSIQKFTCEGLTNDRELNKIGEYLVDVYRDAKETGALQTVEKKDYESFAEYLMYIANNVGQIDVFTSDWLNNILPKMFQLTKQAGIMSNKYDVVSTNPPYMNKLDENLKKFINHKYTEYSGDLFSVFIYRNLEYCKVDGYASYMTPFVWMFIKTYEHLRNYILDNKFIVSLIQMEYSAYEEATVPICSFVLKNGVENAKTLCIKLSDFKGGMDVQRQMVLQAISELKCPYFYETSQNIYKLIPGNPIAYWIGENTASIFKENKINDIAFAKAGIVTGDDKKFLRIWYEIANEEIDFTCEEYEYNPKVRWVPMNKGGSYRKYYGNYEFVMNIYDLWTDGKTNSSVRRGDTDSYFKEAITWSMVTSNKTSFRYSKNKVFGVASPAIFMKNMDLRILGYLNSKVVEYFNRFLNPTINILTGNILSLPYIEAPDWTLGKVEECIRISQEDWDSYETSWDFIRHPLVPSAAIKQEQLTSQFEKSRMKKFGLISWHYENWKNQCEKRFNQLKSDEVELNSIFIDIYGLQDELTPEVEDKDITVRKADLQRDIYSFVSYAVGCMFGRYSLDEDGLAFAGSEWDNSKYTSFTPDTDNIIPITDEEYFSDDIVGRFVEFVKTAYGADTLEENLGFIANALGNKGDTSREVIRNYFLKEFYADHLKVYQKRPIYWLFDSGKQNGFKALIYMHRYDADTVGRVRTDYLHKAQKYVETAMQSAQYTIDNATSASEKSKATKAVTKYTKQLAEMKIYDEAIAHVANQRIEIDLDDGVKVNYAKFQGVEVAQEGKKALKIDLLAKI